MSTDETYEIVGVVIGCLCAGFGMGVLYTSASNKKLFNKATKTVNEATEMVNELQSIYEERENMYMEIIENQSKIIESTNPDIAERTRETIRDIKKLRFKTIINEEP